MMGIHGEARDSRAGAGCHRPRSKWAVKEWHERLGQAAGEWLQAISESGAEDEGLIHRAGVKGR